MVGLFIPQNRIASEQIHQLILRKTGLIQNVAQSAWGGFHDARERPFANSHRWCVSRTKRDCPSAEAPQNLLVVERE
jgi:hypothetical protein